MTDLTTAPPLTRRQAREIERRTGQRPVADALATATASIATTLPARNVHDTAHIERNAVTSLLSVVPTEAFDRNAFAAVAAPAAASLAQAASAAEGSAFSRATSTRAARPAGLIARTRRRKGVGIGLAASAAVLATAVVAAPGAVAGAGAEQAGQAALVTADGVADSAADLANVPGAAPADAPATGLVAAPDAATDRAEFSVASFEPAAVAEVVTEPTPTDTTSTDTTSTGTTSTGTSTGSSGSTQTAGGDASSGSIDLAGIAATAASMVGTGGYTHCDAFVREAYAQHGITLGVGVSAQAAQGRATSDPQPGDLVVWPGQHIGIYAGNGMVYDSPGIDDPRPIQHRAISWGNPYYVTLN